MYIRAPQHKHTANIIISRQGKKPLGDDTSPARYMYNNIAPVCTTTGMSLNNLQRQIAAPS